MAPEQDLDLLAEMAFELAERVRDESPIRVRANMLSFVLRHPLKAAQLQMVFAVYLDPGITTAGLWQRVDAVARRPIGRTS